MTSLKTSIKTITYLSDIGCLEIQGASLLVAPENVLFFHSPIQLYCAKQKVEFYLTARKICISLFYHSYIFIQTINFFLIIMIKVLIVNRCRASGMEGGTPLFHMIPE